MAESNFQQSLIDKFKKDVKKAKIAAAESSDRKYTKKVLNECFDALGINWDIRSTIYTDADIALAARENFAGTFIENLHIVHEVIEWEHLVKNKYTSKEFWRKFIKESSNEDLAANISIAFEVHGWGTCVLFRSNSPFFNPTAGIGVYTIFARETVEENAYITSLSTFLENLQK